MNSRNEIGGYFGLELINASEYHKNLLRLNTGRNALEFILRNNNYKCIYIPRFTCDVILQPIEKLGIKYEFYDINVDLEPDDDFVLKATDAFLYTNYFGVKGQFIKKYKNKINNLIIDNSQAFFDLPEPECDTFYSCRKFFGVPDGAYVFIKNLFSELHLEADISVDRFSHLLKRIEINAEAGYSDYKKNDQSLNFNDIKKMSSLTFHLMQSIDYVKVKQRRIENFKYLHNKLNGLNKLSINMDGNIVPMVYPFLFEVVGLREELIKEKIFIAKYWPNSFITDRKSTEWYLVNNLLALPIDQRYSRDDMERIVYEINKFV